jgi:hypothetical protein
MPRVCYPQKKAFPGYCTCNLPCPEYATPRRKLFQDIALVICPGVHHSLLVPTSNNEKKGDLLNIVLYGSENETIENNLLIFKCVQNYLIQSKRFDCHA